MTHEQEIHAGPAGRPLRAAEPVQSLKFEHDNAFQRELGRRVEDHFRAPGQRQRDCWQMYVKTAVLLAGFAGSYALLVFGAQAWWQGVLLAMLLGLAAAGIGFNIQHDGGHQAYSSHHWVNKLMAMTLELIGGSSHLWRGEDVVPPHTDFNNTGPYTHNRLRLPPPPDPPPKRPPHS